MEWNSSHQKRKKNHTFLFAVCSTMYSVSLRTKINLKKRSDLPGEINSDIKNMCSNKQNATLKQKIMVQDNKKMWF